MFVNLQMIPWGGGLLIKPKPDSKTLSGFTLLVLHEFD
jgi:hypothetical protein